jgi:hypothetical protein
MLGCRFLLCQLDWPAGLGDSSVSDPHWQTLPRGFGSPRPSAGEGLGVRGLHDPAFSKAPEESPDPSGVDLSLTAIMHLSPVAQTCRLLAGLRFLGRFGDEKPQTGKSTVCATGFSSVVALQRGMRSSDEYSPVVFLANSETKSRRPQKARSALHATREAPCRRGPTWTCH